MMFVSVPHSGFVARLVQIVRGDTEFPKWLSPGAQDILKRILDPNPITRINVTGIKAHDWFNQDYTSVAPIDDEEDLCLDDTPCSIKEVTLKISNVLVWCLLVFCDG